MKIAIIGAGFTGLSAAYNLIQEEHEITIFEKDLQPGGLALGFKKPEWQWSLEEYYHHWFTNDHDVLHLAKQINYEVIVKRPQTSVFVQNHIYQLDSASHVLSFPLLNTSEKLRMGFSLALLKYNPFWKPLEKYTASSVLPHLMGKKAYQMLWEPQLKNKFGPYADDVSLSWFWARIAKRTESLAYPKGGFLEFAQTLANSLMAKGVKIQYNSTIPSIEEKNNSVIVGKYGAFDAVLVTLSSFSFLKLCPQLPEDYRKALMRLKGLGALTLILRLKEKFFPDNTYWLSVCDTSSPIMAIVEHTNFMDKKFYNNEHIVYVGNYLSQDHPYFSMNKKELLTTFTPTLQKVNPTFNKNIIDIDVCKTQFAQPIIPTNYSHMVPSITTPLKHIFLANMQQVYPWDRGTNYAVELGKKAAKIIA